MNQPWGTAAPVKYRDPVYQLPVELGAYGNFSFRLTDARRFFTEVTGLGDTYAVAQAKQLLQSRIGQALATQLAAAGLSYQELDAQLASLSARLREALAAEFASLGVELTDFRLSGTIFDAATQQRIGRVADVSAEAQAAATAGLSYAELEQLKALREAARNPGGRGGPAAGSRGRTGPPARGRGQPRARRRPRRAAPKV